MVALARGRRPVQLVPLLALVVAAALQGPPARGAFMPPVELRVVADVDDDDADGVPDGEQALVSADADCAQLPLPTSLAPIARRVTLGAGAQLRVLVDGRPLASGHLVPHTATKLAVQATGPAGGTVRVGSHRYVVRALAVMALDGQGRQVDLARSHASLQRTPPAGLSAGFGQPDPDALRFVLVAQQGELPARLDVRSVDETGATLQQLRDVQLSAVACPQPQPGRRCVATAPIRAVSLAVDVGHPLVAGRSLRAVLGGALVLLDSAGRKLQMIRIGAPRTAAAPAPRLRARVRAVVVRSAPAGAVPLGGDGAGAIVAVREALQGAAALWASCGISFGRADELDIRIVDPPPSHLLAVGCGFGLVASGGQVEVSVAGQVVRVQTRAGMLPREVARQLAGALRRQGFRVELSDNPRAAGAAHPSTDLSVRHPGGELAQLDPPASGRVSTDPSLGVCIGEVDLEDGLQHFTNPLALVGTLEERTLIKALQDSDPTTIDVFVVAGLAGGARIGESFIGGDDSAIRNVVVVDRAGIRVGRAAFTLAHELGHVLLDDPGHSDDYAADTPTRLMDADAAEPTAFGPWRLRVVECERAWRQSGPEAPVPLLTPWPWSPIP